MPMTLPASLNRIEQDVLAALAPPSPEALRGLDAMLARVSFDKAASVSAELRSWHTWPKELLRSALLSDVPPVIVGSVKASRQLRRFEAQYPAAAALFRILTIGEPVGVEKASAIPRVLLDRIEESGIASESQGLWTPRFRVVPLHGLFLLADFPRSRTVLENSFVQLGFDSAMLAHMIVHESAGGSRALDLCTGGGIQALLLATRFASVDATDLNPRAIEMARANAALNGIEGPLRLHEGDLYDGASGRYDLITANPPYVFFPEHEAKTNFTGHGGELGIDVTLRILKGLASRLSDDGRALVYTQGPRIGGHCQLVEATSRRLAGEPLHVEFEEIVRGYWSAFRDFYRSMRVEWLTAYRVRVRRAARFECTVRPLNGWRRSAVAAAVAIERGGWL